MTNEQQMHMRKLHEQKGIKPTVKKTSTEVRVAALEAQQGISSYPEEGDIKK